MEPRDMDALKQLLVERGLGAHAELLVRGHAGEALMLVAPDEGAVRPGSRLGGPAVVDPAVGWPLGPDGRPLAFLAALDLAELDAARVVPGLPDAGWLVFYADLDDEQLYDRPSNTPGGPFSVQYIEPGRSPVESSRDDVDDTLRDRPVASRRLFLLSDSIELRYELDLDDDAAQTLEDLAWELLPPADPDPAPAPEATDAHNDDALAAYLERIRAADEAGIEIDTTAVDYDWRDPDDGRSLGAHHWVGGPATGAQGHATEPGTVLLLHLAHDSKLGFTWADGGAFQFRIDADALAARDWAQIVLHPDSG